MNGPLIVQSDRTVLLEAAHEQAAQCRGVLARFAELEKSPEHIHTYRITPLSLWNARAAGMTAGEMTDALRDYSRYPVPESLLVEIADQVARYGRLRIEAAGQELRLVAADAGILEEVVRAKTVRAMLGARISPNEFALASGERGRLKQALLRIGWPAEDLAGYTEGAPLEIQMRAVTRSGLAFGLRDYQRDAGDGFWAAGGPTGGSGVLVLPCGAGKTLIGLDAMCRANTRTLILATSIIAARQWRDELIERTTLEPDQIGEYSGAEKSIRPVTIATYQVMTYRKRGARGEMSLEAFPHLSLFNAENWGLIIYDEVHLLPAPVFRMTAEIQSKRRLGLTATLIREDGREDDVFSLIGPKRFDAPWRELEAQGWIAPATCTEVRVAMPPDLRMEYAVAESADRYRIAATNPNKMPVVHSLLKRHAGDRVLVIGQYLDQLDEVARQLGAPLVTGKTPAVEREKLYQGLRDGSVRVLIVSKVANFSIDLPEANVAIQISGTFGSRQEEAQRLGRILRPKADGGQAHFYTVISRESRDQDFALHRQLFLAEQGYRYDILDESAVLSPS